MGLRLVVRKFVHYLLAEFDASLVRLPRELARQRSSVYRPTLAAVVAYLGSPKSPLTCVQVGSFDGKTNDELFPLVRLHEIRYIGIEPQREAFRRLQANCSDLANAILINAALGDCNDSRTMFRVKPDRGDYLRTGQLASFDRSVILREPGIRETDIEEIQVEVRTLASCLGHAGVTQIDIAQIDCEGSDDMVVAQVLQLSSPPAIIRYEGKHLSRRASRDVISRLIAAGYEIAFSPVDVIAVRLLAELSFETS